MTTNETIVFGADGAVSVQDRPVPEPGPEELLVETERSLVSTGTELALLHGDYGDLPAESPGYCTVGRVVEVGGNAAEVFPDVGVGDRVGAWTGHGRYHTVDTDDWWFPVPEAPTDAEAAFGAIAQITMNGVRKAEVEWGDAVVVFGLGLLGQFAARLAVVAGARPVVGVDLDPDRVDYLPEHPALVPTVGGDVDVASVVEDANHGRPADVGIEATGVAAAIPEQFDALGAQSRLAILGSPRDTTEFDFYEHCHRPGHEIVGAHVGTHPLTPGAETPWTMERNAELFFDYLVDGTLEVESLVSREVPVERAPSVYADLEADRTEEMGVQFVW